MLWHWRFAQYVQYTQLVVLFNLFLQYIIQRCNFIHMFVTPFGFLYVSVLLGLYSYFSWGNQILVVGSLRPFKTELWNCRAASLLKILVLQFLLSNWGVSHPYNRHPGLLTGSAVNVEFSVCSHLHLISVTEQLQAFSSHIQFSFVFVLQKIPEGLGKVYSLYIDWY